MKRIRFLILFTAVLTSLWLWQAQHQVNEQQTLLLARITADRAVLTASKRLRPGVGEGPVAGRAGLSGETVPTGPVPLDVDHFLNLGMEITRMESSIPAGGDRSPMRAKISEIFTRLSVTPPDQLKAIMEQLPGLGLSEDGKAQVATAIMNLLAEADPPAAAAFALGARAKPGTLELALRGWSKRDAAGAAAWLDQAEREGKLPASANAGQLHLLLLPQLIAADPGGAVVEKIGQLPQAQWGDLFSETARLLTTSGQRKAFLERLTTLPGLPSGAVGQFMHQVGRELSVQAAVELLQEVGPSLPADQFDTIATATATARIDAGTPAQADWLLKNLRGPQREPAIAHLMETWTQADFNGAAGWLKQQAPSADHDAAIASFAPLVADKEPPSAVDWAVTIADPTRKTAVLENLYRAWHSREPERAAAYFQEKGLTPPSL